MGARAMSNEPMPPENGDESSPPRLDARLVQWLALQMVQDARARLVEGGASADATIELATVFVDLKVTVRGECDRRGVEPAWVIQKVCGLRATTDDATRPTPRSGSTSSSGSSDRWLLVGGPGSGKSTATTMISQLLRRSWIEQQREDLPEALNAKVDQFALGLDTLATRLEVQPRPGVLPLRVNLPSLAQWMVPQNLENPADVVWRYLATRMMEDAASQGLTIEVSEGDVATMIGAVDQVLWIFDGLDEVPRTAGRDKVVAVVRAALGSDPHRAPGLLVTTRPQGYEGELDDLATMVLEPMPVEQARDYGARLLQAWIGDGPEFPARREALGIGLERPEIQALVQTPLHTTMATLLVAMQGSLPRSRWLLFDHYFTTIFQRELGKPGEHGIREEDRRNLRDLHARAGLVLHVRAQDQAGARPMLSRRALHEELTAIFREKKHAEEDVTENTSRMMRFATERLVLLLHERSGEYSFGIRSLQEFFAADALLHGERAQVRKRLEVIALNPHWANVLALVASKCALADGGQPQTDLLDYTVGLCRALNDGMLGGEAAKRGFAGSRLALAMLRETEHYGEPWLHDPLWEIAFEAGKSPVQLQVRRRSIYESMRELRDHGSTPSLWNDALEFHMRLGLVAARWGGQGITNKKRRHAAVNHAARDLLSGPPERWLPGWFLLYGLLLVDEPDAVQLAEQYAPDNRDAGRQLVNALLAPGAEEDVPNWLVQFIQAHAEWFTPARLLMMGVYGDALQRVFPFNIANILYSRPGRYIRFRILENLCTVRVNIIDNSHFRSRWSDIAGMLPTAGLAWEIWRKLAAFHEAPSHTALADLLEIAVEPAIFEDLELSLWAFAWPVVACIKFVGESEELRSLAVRVRNGDLGTIIDWRAAEARWGTAPSVTLEELQEWISADALPWNRTITVSGVVLAESIFGSSGSSKPADPKHLALRTALFQQITTVPQRSARASAIVRLLLPMGMDVIPLQVARSYEEIGVRSSVAPPFSVDEILPSLMGPDADGWFNLLDERGRRGGNQSSGSSPHHRRSREVADALVLRLRERPDQWGLASALLVMLRIAPDTDLAKLPRLEVPADAPLDVPATTAFLRLLARTYEATEFSPLVHQVIALGASAHNDFYDVLADILAERTSDPDQLLKIIVAALDEGPTVESFRDALFGALFARLRRSARPAFATAGAWREHELPGPFLAAQEPERAPPRLVRLVELINLRLFKETPSVEVPFPVPAVNAGQWIILTGENGIGKTTLLRALALALAPPSVASKLLDERLPMMRNGGEGRITIELDSGTLDAVVGFKERTETVERGTKEAEGARRPWVVGYGVRRGNARGEQDRETEWGPTGELHTLFDRPASLVNASDWLIKLERQVLREQRQQSSEVSSAPLGSRAAIWDSVVSALKTLLSVTAVEPADDHVFVQHPHFGRVRLDALSDGYLTTTGWVIDLIARWIDRQRVLDEPIGPNVLHEMTGFVIIDEIDLHLHPVWQMVVISNVRRLFPRLSFIVTTHNPLTLQGARPGEVYVMRRDGSRIELAQRDIHPVTAGHDVDRVLFEQFGIEHTFDKATRDLLKRHRELLERGARLDDPTRVATEAQLAERLGSVGEIVRAERRGATDPLPELTPDEQDFLAPILKKKS